MPQARASKTRMVGMPIMACEYCWRGMWTVSREPRVDSGRVEVGQIAAVADAGLCKGRKPSSRVADAVDGGVRIAMQLARGLSRNSRISARAFAVAPVADPDDVLFLAVTSLSGLKDGGVRGFVQGPDVLDTEAFAVDGSERLAEGENAVEASQAEEIASAPAKSEAR